MGMYFVSNQSHPRSHFRGEARTRQVTQPVVAPPTTLTTLTTLQAAPIAQQSEPLAQQSVTSIITRTRPRPTTSRFNMNDTFASRGRPCG